MRAQVSDRKKAIVVVSFGTAYPDTRQTCIASVENAIQKEFPAYTVQRVFTSKIVRQRIAEQENITINELETTLTKLQTEGYREIVVQTTHFTAGEEFDKKVIAVIGKFQESKAFDSVSIGRPVLFFTGQQDTPDDFAILVEALKEQLPLLQMPDCAILWMGHGSSRQHNPAYHKLQKIFDVLQINAVVGVIEEVDHPNFEDALQLLKARKYKQVVLMPLLLVAGGHTNRDMAGEHENSWKHKLLKEGFTVKTYLHGLGENKAIQEIYVQHVKDAILGLYPIQR